MKTLDARIARLEGKTRPATDAPAVIVIVAAPDPAGDPHPTPCAALVRKAGGWVRLHPDPGETEAAFAARCEAIAAT